MYKVTTINNNIGYTIHNSNASKLASKIKNTSITQGINSIGSFTFTIYQNNPAFNILYPYKSKIYVYNKKKNKYIFKGRVLKIKPSMNEKGLISKTIICEDRLGYLQDSIQPYCEEKNWTGDEERTGLEEFIDYILNNHNLQVEEDKKIYRGNVNVKPFESSDNITKGLNYETTWEIIQNKLINSFGGEIQLREENNILYLDYLKEIGVTKSTSMELKKNMQSIDREIDPTSFITKLIPLGAKLKKETTDSGGNIVEEETEERLTIASVNDGSIFINASEQTNLGSIVKTVIFDDVTVAQILLSRGQKYLEENNKLLEKHTVKALDLSLIDESVDEFEVGNYYPIKNKLIDLNTSLRIIKRTINILEPLSSTFDLGDSKQSLSTLTLENTNRNLNAIEEIRKEYVPNNKLTETITKLTTLISQTANEIQLEVAEDYTLKTDFTASAQRLASLILQVNSIQQIVNNWSDLTTTVEGSKILELKDAIEGNIIYLSLRGQLNFLYPSNDLYPSDDLYPISSYITVEHPDNTIENTELPFDELNYMNDDVYDEFIIDSTTAYVVKRVGKDNNNQFYELEEEIVKKIENFKVNLVNGTNKLYLPSFKRILPEEYTQVDYIESTGTQYIDTLFYPNQDTKVEITFETLTLPTGNHSIFGSRYEANNKHYGITLGGDGRKIYSGYGNQSVAVGKNLKTYTKYNLIKDKRIVILDNEILHTNSQYDFQTTYSMYLFSMNQKNKNTFNTNLKMYSCKIYDNDTLVRNFIPCYRNSDNEIGLYDTVNNVFYTNQGTGEFNYGKVIDTRLNISVKYVVKNAFTDVFATTALLSSSITQLAESINLTVSKKVNASEIISTINQTAEEIKILANKLSFEGATIDMTADDVKIKGKNLDIDSNGIITLTDNSAEVALQGGDLKSAYVIESENTVDSAGTITNLKFKNQILAQGRNLKVEENWKYQSETGGGIFGIIEGVYSQPRITLYNQSQDYDAISGTGSYQSLDISLIGGIIYDNQDLSKGTSSTPLMITPDGNIRCVKLTQTSKAEIKKNFEKLINAKEILNSTDIYKYNFKDEDDNVKKSIGLIIGDGFNYSEEITSENNEGANIYSMVSVLWQVVKEQQLEIKELKEMIKNGKNSI